MKSLSSVEVYIAQAPKETQEKLKEVRAAIKDAAPNAKEGVSYGMPFYSYKGRLVYFGLFKRHVGLYIPPPIIEQHKDELKKYTTSKSAVQFPLINDLPISLIKKLVKAR